MNDRLSQMLDDDPVGLEPAPPAPAAGENALQRVKALKGRSAAARSTPESDASDVAIAEKTAETLGWKGSKPPADAAKPRVSRRRRDPNAEPKEVLYVRAPRSILNGFLQYCEDSNMTQAEGFIAMCKKHLPKGYLTAPSPARGEHPAGSDA